MSFNRHSEMFEGFRLGDAYRINDGRAKKPSDPDYDPNLPDGGLDPKYFREDYLKSSYINYLFGEGSDNPFDREAAKFRQPWRQNMGGRAATRMFSRFVLGAGFYVWGQHQVGKQLAHYHHDIPLHKLPEGHSFRPLRYLARFFDHAYGTPIKAVVKTSARAFGETAAEAERLAESAVTFRESARYAKAKPEEIARMGADYDKMTGFAGRSIGAEVVSMTFDFAMGSVGDALGREIVGWVDPNHPKTWLENGRFNSSDFISHLGHTAWKIFSLNQMEDWAAALPYVYQMKFQRHVLNKAWPGFNLVSDRQLNGGGVRIDPNTGKSLYSYALPGLLDLQARFTGYNWYTLMFRDSYNKISNALEEWGDNGYALDKAPLPSVSNPLQSASDTIRYALKSGIKATIYMTPAVPFFWLFRTPQTKFRQMETYMDENGVMQIGLKEKPTGVHSVREIGSGTSTNDNELTKQERNFEKGASYHSHMKNKNGEWVKVARSANPYQKENLVGLTDRLLNPFGKLCHVLGDKLYKGLVDTNLITKGELNQKLTRDYMNAAMAYTPYMYMKGETAIRYDNPVMDDAIYKFLDGLFTFDGSKIRSGSRTIRNLITHPPYEVVDMEARKQTGIEGAQKRAEKKATSETEKANGESERAGLGPNPSARVIVDAPGSTVTEAQDLAYSQQRPVLYQPYAQKAAELKKSKPTTKVAANNRSKMIHEMMEQSNFHSPERPPEITLH